MTQPYYAITALYPPAIANMHNGKRYAISGSIWIEIGPEITQKMVQDVWTPLYANVVKPSSAKVYSILSKSSGKTYTVKHEGNRWSCSCPAFGFRNKCKHIEEAKTK